MKLHKFQKQGLKQIIDGFKAHQKIMLAWYTGSGKTNVISDFCKHLIKENPNVKIGISSYYTTEIRDQLITRFASHGLSKYTQNITNKSKLSKNRNIFVFIPQPVAITPPDIKFDYFIIDEAHHGTRDENVILNHIIKKCTTKKTKILGASATPWDGLNQKLFKDALVLKRSIQDGLSDKTICDIKINTEQINIEFSDDDFSRTGDLIVGNDKKNLAVLKSKCEGVFEAILTKHDKIIGNKCVVICPPGNGSEIARDLARKFKSLFFIGDWGRIETKERQAAKAALTEFKNKPNERFLFVVKKCGVGFDYPELSSVIDLTMSRNLTNIVQRIGRLSRKYDSLRKNYFYVYDKSLKDRVDWVLMSAVDVSLGEYDGWTTKTFKYRPIDVPDNFSIGESRSISEIISALKESKSITSKYTIRYTENNPMKNRTVAEALREVKQYKNRYELYQKDAALYKWLRIHAKEEFQKVLPAKKFTNWTEELAIKFMKTCTSRNEFQRAGRGCDDWLRTKGKLHLKDKYLPPSKTTAVYTHEIIIETLKRCNKWSDLRNKFPRVSDAIRRKNLSFKYKTIFNSLKNGENYESKGI